MFRIGQLTLAVAILCALVVAGHAAASPLHTSHLQVAAKHGANKVHEAWPHKKGGRKPETRLGRKLAKQIGPIRIGKKAHRAPALVPAATADRQTSAGGSPGVVGVTKSTDGRLLLVRSFDIPKDDPLYANLSNYSWTYDNALAVLAFVADGSRSQARELLDQLKALQAKDGSIDFAFDVMTGGSSAVIRSGADAWVGLAATAYRTRYGDRSYDSMIGGLVGYLLKLRDEQGLVTGGPDVSWASTQHNLLTAELLRELRVQNAQFGAYGPKELAEAETSLDSAIDKLLIVDDGIQVYFKEGFDDDRIPIDVQALGAMYLQTHGDSRAQAVADFMLQKGFFVPTVKSKETGYEVSGLRPFLDPEAPELIWTEGTVESQFSLTRLGIEDPNIADAVKSLEKTIKGNAVGPIGANRDSVSIWGEYRTWPTSAATSWLMMLKRNEEVSLFSR